ncbi:hypothetical protein, partial [Klebsiella pneumoniae]|uniref:hypothetical protein n=1 Tax=Klebsiella pneumoniae TaxID=573 RepID=UPI001BB0E581
RRTLYKQTVYRLCEMFNPSAALFANTMLMFRLMFFHNKKPDEAGFIILQCLFSGTYPVY